MRISDWSSDVCSSDLDEDEEEENSISLAAMEAALLPQVLDTFDEISKTWKKITKVQEKRLTHLQRGEKIVPATEKRYEKLTQELVALMEGVHFNNNRLEQLVDQLYGLNRRLLTFEGKMLRSEEHTSELQSLMRISYAVFCL